MVAQKFPKYDVCEALENGNGILKVHPIQCGCFKEETNFVKVVRCKNCKSYNGHRYCNYHADPVDDNDYCSYGELKECENNARNIV